MRHCHREQLEIRGVHHLFIVRIDVQFARGNKTNTGVHAHSASRTVMWHPRKYDVRRDAVQLASSESVATAFARASSASEATCTG